MTMMNGGRRIALTICIIAIADQSAKNRTTIVNSFQTTSGISSMIVSSREHTQQPRRIISINTRHVFEASSSSSSLSETTEETVDPIISSAASQWMAKELQIEKEMDDDQVVGVASTTTDAVVADEIEIDAAEEADDDDKTPTPHTNNGRWEELHGNYILRPPPSQQQPRALIHFLGGALLGAAPQLTYRYMLERLSSRGYLIVATPYQLSFDHLTTCDEIIDRFELVAPELARGECI